jgi:glycosyltransferase involved in cell wall biosynthesis
MFNAEKYIREVIESVLRTNESVEHIVVDDGSTDSSAEIVREISARDNRVIYLRTENRGESHAVNRAFEASRGEFLAIVNSDDPLLPGHLEKCGEALRSNPEFVVVYPDWIIIDEAGRKVRTIQCPDFEVRSLVCELMCLPGPGALFRRDAILDRNLRNIQLQYLSDYEMWIRLSVQGPFLHFPEVLATWRRHESNLTSAGRGLEISRELLILSRMIADDYPGLSQANRDYVRLRGALLSSVQVLWDRRVGGRRQIFRELSRSSPRAIVTLLRRRNLIEFVVVMTSPVSRIAFLYWTKFRNREERKRLAANFRPD